METGGHTVVADLEAGIGTLTRMGDRGIEALLVVVEPTPRSLEVGGRVVALTRTWGAVRVVVVANRVRDGADEHQVRQAFPGAELVTVPDDPAVLDADRRGLAPIDVTAGSPALQALVGLAERLA